MASKVNLLGERLRGAQFEVSDLRGNIDHLLQDLEDAVFIFNREFRLVFASGSVEKFLGRDRSDLPGQAVSEVFPPSTTLGLLVAQSSATGRAIRNRRVPLGAPGQTLAGPAVVLLSVDILESLPGGPAAASGILVRLRDPEAQRKINRELQTADRLSAISRITSGVAHEVKNPLNAILLHVEVARSKLSRGDTDVAEQMEIISREILRLDRVVRTFLDFTRPVELQLDNVPMQELVREIVDLARPQTAAANIQVTVRQEAEGVEVRVDRDLLKQAVLNVVVNAMQAMPEGGELRFEASASGDTAELRISDTGTGIPPELRDKDLSPLLQHQKGRFGNWSGHDLPDRATSRWYNRFHQRAGKRHHLPDPSAHRGVIHESQGTPHRSSRHPAGGLLAARQAGKVRGPAGGAEARRHARAHAASAGALHPSDPCRAAPAAAGGPGGPRHRSHTAGAATRRRAGPPAARQPGSQPGRQPTPPARPLPPPRRRSRAKPSRKLSRPPS